MAPDEVVGPRNQGSQEIAVITGGKPGKTFSLESVALLREKSR